LKSLVEILPLSLARRLAMRQISQDRSAEVSLHLSQPIGPQQKRDHDRATVGCELPERQEADGLYRAALPVAAGRRSLASSAPSDDQLHPWGRLGKDMPPYYVSSKTCRNLKKCWP
jgi:hypothetical protein